MTSTRERAAQYLRTMPGAITHDGGHKTTWNAACAVRVGFSLDEETAFRLLKEIHNPTCRPRWSDRDLRHKVKSAAKLCKKPEGYLLNGNEREYTPRHRQPTASGSQFNPTGLDAASYNALANALIEACPFDGEQDALDYLERRILIVQGAKAGLAALPPVAGQGALIDKLLVTFDAEVLARAGLIWRDKTTSKPDVSKFAFPHNRLVIPWRGLDGSIDVLQRRRIDDGQDRKYVFPARRKPRLPFGAEALRVSDAAAPIVFAEGALDVLALRLLSFSRNLPMLPLGLPGVDGWQWGWARFARGRDVLVALDGDASGDDAVKKISIALRIAGAKTVKRWRPRGAKDWCELVENQARAAS